MAWHGTAQWVTHGTCQAAYLDDGGVILQAPAVHVQGLVDPPNTPFIELVLRLDGGVQPGGPGAGQDGLNQLGWHVDTRPLTELPGNLSSSHADKVLSSIPQLTHADVRRRRG
jgi:hypothetical protein